MSWQACAWAIRQTVATRSADRHLLLVLANYAGEDGQNCFPSQARLARDTGLTERGVRVILDRLEKAGLIRRGDQRIAEVKIARPDRRPIVYDLNLALVDLPPAERPEAPVDVRANGGNDVPPAAERGEPYSGTGGTARHERGEYHSPDPSLKPSEEPSPRARGGGDPDGPPPRALGAQPDHPGAEAAPDRQPDHQPWRQAEAEEALERDAARAPLTDAERTVRRLEANYVLEWIKTARVPDYARSSFRLSSADLMSEAAIERAVLARDSAGARRGASYARWALMWADNEPNCRNPACVPEVARLAAALGPPGAASEARGRLAKLLSAYAARAAADGAPATGPPQADSRAA